MPAESPLHLTDDRYLLQRGSWELFRQTCRIYDSNGALVLYSKVHSFRRRTAIAVFRDDRMVAEVMSIQARQDAGRIAAYYVSDSLTGETLGGFRKRRLRSFSSEGWSILDSNGEESGKIIRQNRPSSVLRFLLINFEPIEYQGSISGEPVFTLTQHFSPFATNYGIKFSVDSKRIFDRRMGIAAAILLTGTLVRLF